MNFLYSLLQTAYHKVLEIKSEKYLQKLVANGLTIGEGTQITDIDSVFFDPSHCYLITIGRRCIIAPNVRFIAHDASTKLFLNYTKFAKIEVNDESFIGDSAILLPGVSVGPHSIVAASAVVTRDVPPNTIVAGNPARVISTLDAYLAKIRKIEKAKKVFNENYYIEHLTKEKKKELLESIGSDFGLII